MLDLDNDTPFAADLAVLPDEQGADTLYVTVKATFDLGGSPSVAAEQVPLHRSDTYWGEPGQSSLRHAAEIHLAKPATDVVLVGQAHAPDRRPTPWLDVTLAVGPVQKTLRVFGDRRWIADPEPCISDPVPFVTMPLVYERAFGGTFSDERGVVCSEGRNPVGCGLMGPHRGREIHGLALPNLEDPRDLIARPEDRPAPACLGHVAPSWEPRRRFVGSYDEKWQRGRAPFLPEDFDPRFFCAAHPDLICPGHLSGGEQVRVKNAAAAGPLSFPLPIYRLVGCAFFSNREEDLRFLLETVLVEPDAGRLIMISRAALRCDTEALKVELVALEVEGL